MSDVTQGADAPDDASLFSDATTTTLEKFENPAEPLPKLVEPKPDGLKEPPKDAPKEPPKDSDAPVPAGRLREEAEARRRAERERDDLLRQLAMARQPPQPQQPPPKPPDVFENPSGFVQNEVKPLIDQFKQEMQLQREAYSMDMAAQRFGPETVAHSRQALEHFMKNGDPMAWATYNRAMQSHDPYGVIAGWYQERSLLHEVGGDLNGYRQRILEEAMKNPDFQRQVIEASKGGAQHVARPATSSVPKIPSLGSVGAGGGETDLQEPSDDQLFRAAVTARRK
jgi:hypothetical protein